jgi:hypothetical protein
MNPPAVAPVRRPIQSLSLRVASPPQVSKDRKFNATSETIADIARIPDRYRTATAVVTRELHADPLHDHGLNDEGRRPAAQVHYVSVSLPGLSRSSRRRRDLPHPGLT